MGRAGSDLGAEGSGPAEGEDKIDGAAVFNGGEGAGGGGWPAPAQAAIHSSSSLRCAQKCDAVAGGVGPVADERLELAGKGGDDGDAGHMAASLRGVCGA